MSERDLPVIDVHGTDFIVDVANMELREKANMQNVIAIKDMWDDGNNYVFEYSLREKNMPQSMTDEDEIKSFKLAQLIDIDPAGMAEKHGLTVDALAGKTDRDLMMGSAAVQKRLKGNLPTIEIAGDLFYVDLRMDMLRPHNDFLSKGINFSDIDHYYSVERDAYMIPYNPSKREFQEIDPHTITEIPKDLIVISFPLAHELDPIGFNRLHGINEFQGVQQLNVKSHSVAQTIDWKHTGIEQTIKENLEKSQKLELSQDDTIIKQEQKHSRKLDL